MYPPMPGYSRENTEAGGWCVFDDHSREVSGEWRRMDAPGSDQETG